MEPLVLKERKVIKAFREVKECKAPPERLALKGFRDCKVQTDYKVLKDNKAIKGVRALKDQQAQPAVKD
jgi:hypothetical protein